MSFALFIGMSCGCAGDQVEAKSQPYAALEAKHHLAEGDTGKPALEEEPVKPNSDPPSAENSEPLPADLPDPPPLVTKEHYRVEVRYLHGVVSVGAIRQEQTEKPMATARRMGRYAFELWIGRELIDRVRFDFPLLGAAPTPDEAKSGAPNLAAGADVSTSFLVPSSERATRARILDRASGRAIVVPWPPTSTRADTENAGQPAPGADAS